MVRRTPCIGEQWTVEAHEYVATFTTMSLGGSACFAKQGKRDSVRLQGSKDTVLYAGANRGLERMSDVATMNKAAPTGSKGRLIIWVLLIVAVLGLAEYLNSQAYLQNALHWIPGLGTGRSSFSSTSRLPCCSYRRWFSHLEPGRSSGWRTVGLSSPSPPR